MDYYVEYVEPEIDGSRIKVSVAVSEAIRRAKEVAAHNGHTYRTNMEALQDFMAVHWA